MAISSNGSFMVASISPSVGSKDDAPWVGDGARDCLSVRLRYTARRPRSAKLLGVTLARPDEALFLLPSPGLPTPTEDARPLLPRDGRVRRCSARPSRRPCSVMVDPRRLGRLGYGRVDVGVERGVSYKRRPRVIG